MAHFTPEARAQIIAALPEAAAWFDRRPARTPARPAKTATGTRTNRHPGSCVRCHGHVAEGQGSLKLDGGKWLVYHADGQCPEKPQTPAATPQPVRAPAARRATPNRYAGKCVSCSAWIEAGAGLLTGGPGHWGVTHDGDCPAAVPVAAPAKTGTPAVSPGDLRVPLTAENIAALTIGMATCEMTDGTHTTFKIRVRKDDAPWGAGQTQILYLAGPNNEESYRHLGVIEGDTLVLRHPIHSARMRNALAILINDRAAAGLGWALEAGRCYRCGRLLTVPASLHAGLGPDCANK